MMSYNHQIVALYSQSSSSIGFFQQTPSCLELSTVANLLLKKNNRALSKISCQLVQMCMVRLAFGSTQKTVFVFVNKMS